jgi:hypothetical protein
MARLRYHWQAMNMPTILLLRYNSLGVALDFGQGSCIMVILNQLMRLNQ